MFSPTDPVLSSDPVHHMITDYFAYPERSMVKTDEGPPDQVLSESVLALVQETIRFKQELPREIRDEQTMMRYDLSVSRLHKVRIFYLLGWVLLRYIYYEVISFSLSVGRGLGER